MADLDHLLDDALAGFDDDGDVEQAALTPPTPPPPAQQQQQPQQPQAAAAASSSRPPPAPSTPSTATATTSKQPQRMQFDPLAKRTKGSKAAATASKAAAGSGGAASSQQRPDAAELNRLQHDLAQLLTEWDQAANPDEVAGLSPQQQQHGGNIAVLQALQEQTQRTVDQQARARPPPAAAAGVGAGGEGGGEQQQMSMIVDVVMQHLLSKDVLYQPMKEIADKYPPWLEKHAAAGSSSSLSAADLDRYRRQYDCITRLCAAYESQPSNTSNIMALLQEMQACGEPPEEIVADMTSSIAADLPNLAGAAADAAGGGGGLAGGLGDLNFDDLDLGGLADVPDLKNCPVQ